MLVMDGVQLLVSFKHFLKAEDMFMLPKSSLFQEKQLKHQTRKEISHNLL